MPASSAHPRYAVLAEACGQIGRYAVTRGVTFAIETGTERSDVLRRFLDDLGGLSAGLGVNLDPANLAMVHGEDSVTAVRNLADYTVHTHAKDGVHLQSVDVNRLYKTEPLDQAGIIQWQEYFRETPLGEGQVDFDRYLSALHAAGYAGYLTIEREVGADPQGDIQKAVDFLDARLRLIKVKTSLGGVRHAGEPSS